jgi:O-antigen/teichoic acid export membrane protein
LAGRTIQWAIQRHDDREFTGMRLSGNLLAGLANSIWSALIGLAVVPFYLKYLGIEAYGLIGFFVTTQALLSLLDMGLAPTINREVARHSASGNLKEAGKLLHTLAIIYWGMAGVISLLIVSLAPLITEHWLQSKFLSQQTIEHAVMLMGLVVACRWPIGLYQSTLVGAQRLTISSGISIAMVTLGSLGAVMVLAFVAPTIEAFFIWQAGIGLVYAATMRWAAWRVIGRLKDRRFDFDKLKQIWRFSAGMSGVAVSGIILMQLDKVLLSKILSLEDFGRYALAGVVANGLYVLLTPTFNVIYPRLSALVVTGETDKLIELYRSGTRLLSSVLFPIATAIAVFAEEILSLWTGNLSFASSMAPIAALLLIGTALNGVMHFPYALQLAFGMTRLPLMINGILVIIMIPMTILLAMQFGVIGGATAWALSSGIYLLMGTWLTHKTLLKGLGLKWLLWDVGMPLCLSLLVVGIVGGEVREWGYSNNVELFIGSGLAFFAFLLVILLSPRLRFAVQNNFFSDEKNPHD